MKVRLALGAVLPAILLVACGNEAPTSAAANSDQSAAPEAVGARSSGTLAASEAYCLDFGPQTPRDISNAAGKNAVLFDTAPPASEMNLCNIHTHTNAEHKGPGFSVFVNDSDSGGYACNDAKSLSANELADPSGGNGAYKGVKPGDTIEVHWVHSSCDVAPGEGLGACLTDSCANPVLRVEAQAFLVVNDPNALDFNDFDYSGSPSNGLHQAKSLPTGTGEPVTFLGSTTGPSYTQATCSPAQVTWNVRPMCARVDISSLHRWAEKGNAFNETKSHGVRQLVTAEELLSPMMQ